MKKGYLCDYCREASTDKEEIIDHEKTCYVDPSNRRCFTCKFVDRTCYSGMDKCGNSNSKFFEEYSDLDDWDDERALERKKGCADWTLDD